MSKIKLSAKDLMNQSSQKLQEQLFLYKKELFNLRFQKVLGELTNISKFSEIKKNVARIKTELSRKAKLGE